MHELENPPVASAIMHTARHTVLPDMSLGDLIEYLIKHHESSVPVVNANDGNLLVGFVSERDCLAALAQESYYGFPAPPQTAGSIMRISPISIPPGTDVFSVAGIFINHSFRQIPVTERGQLLGIVTRQDVLRSLADFYKRYSAAEIKNKFRPDTSLIINHRFLTQ